MWTDAILNVAYDYEEATDRWNGKPQAIITVSEVELDPDDIREWVKDNHTPDEVFDYGALETWALDNGFVPNVEE